jgi:helix-turn-helix protein
MPDLCIIPTSAVEDPRLTADDLRVLCAIGRHSNQEGESAWDFAQKLPVTLRTFSASVERLERFGYVTYWEEEETSETGYSVVLQGFENVDAPDSESVEAELAEGRNDV